MKKSRLAVAIKLLLATSDLNQKDLAIHWDCGESTVTRFLSGESLPEPKTLLRIVQWMLENHA